MDLAKLELFVRVVELGSLSKAALHYDLGAPALSRQLAALEAECKGRLLHRTGRGVRPTELGERVLPRARALLAEAAELASEIDRASGLCVGTVHVACLPVIAAPLITRVVRLARERYPQVVIHASEGLRDQVEQALADGRADLGFVVRLAEEKAADPPLAVSSFCLVGPPGDRFTLRREIEFKDLAGLPLLQPAAGDPFRNAIAELAARNGILLNVVAEVDSVLLMKHMAAAGIGYALLSPMAIEEELRAGRLTATRIVRPEIRRAIHLVVSPRKTSSLAVREVSRLIRQVAEEFAAANLWGDLPPCD